MKRKDKLNIFGRYVRIPGGNMSTPFYIYINKEFKTACFYFYVDGKFWVIDSVVIIDKHGTVTKENVRPKILRKGLFSKLTAKQCMKKYIKKELSNEQG